MQKHTSMNPNAGIGKWSLDFVLNTVFLKLAGRDGISGIVGIDLAFDGFFEAPFFESVFDFEALSLSDAAFFEFLLLVIFFCFFPFF